MQNDFCGVHTNSGVLNFWFFLLSDGGTGTNDIGNTYNVTGLGINTAEEIAYATKLLLNNSNADYPLTRNVSIQAATNLFGANSCEVRTVTDAWFAVGVGPAYNGTLGMTITNPSTAVCTDGTQFTLNNVPLGAQVTWTATPTNLFVVSSGHFIGNGGSHNISLTASSSNVSGSGMLTFEIDAECGTPLQLQREVWVGLTQYLYFSASYNQSQGIMLSTPYVGGGATAQWSINGMQYAGFDIAVQPLCIDYTYQNLDITLTVSNQCDSKSVCTSYTLKCPPQPMLTNMGSCGGGGGGEEPEFHEEYQYSVSPNPTNQLLNISVVTSPDPRKTSESSTGESKSATTIQSIALTDINGYIKYSRQYSSGSTEAEIDVSNLRKGVYILKISNGKHIETHRVIID